MPIKILIENWPDQDFWAQYIPIAIAIVALLISWYTAYLSRKSLTHSQRPYVYANSYSYLDQSNFGKITPVPSMLMYRVSNAPARVKFIYISIILNKIELFNDTQEKDFIHFPDANSQWHHQMTHIKFEEILEKHRLSNEKLIRKVFMKYQSLNGGSIYEFHLMQEYEPLDHQWRDIESNAR